MRKGKSRLAQAALKVSVLPAAGLLAFWTHTAAANNDTITNSVTLNPGDTLNVTGTTEITSTGLLDLEGGSFTTATLTKDSGGSFLADAGQLAITGNQTVIIDTGGLLESANSPDGSSVTVDNTLSFVSIAGQLVIGNTGAGSLQVNNNGYIFDSDNNFQLVYGLVSGSTIIGDQSGSNGTVTIGSSDGSQFGIWVNNGEADLAAHAGATANVTMNSSGWDVYGDINVGGTSTAAGGTATLTLNDVATLNGNYNGTDNDTLRLWSGGTVNLNGGTINIGYLDGSGGTFNFQSGTLNILQSGLDIGAPSDLFNGNLTLNAGSNMSVAGSTNISGNQLQIYGGSFTTGSLSFTHNRAQSVDFTSGNLTINNATTVDISNFTNSSDSSATFALDGGQSMELYSSTSVLSIPAGKTFYMNGGLLVAGSISDPGDGFQYNSGYLILNDPTVPVVVDSGGLIKSSNSPDGSILEIDVNHPFVSLPGQLTVGNTGTGIMDVLNGGSFIGDSNNFVQNYGLASGPVIVGNQSGSVGGVSVGESAFSVYGLWITNGNADLAEKAGANGLVDVDDGDWTVQGDINIGGSSTAAGGNGTVAVGANGTINANYQGLNTNTLRLWPGGKLDLDGGTISVGNIEDDGGEFNFMSGTFNVETGDVSYGPSGTIFNSLNLAAGDALNIFGGNLTVDTTPLVLSGGLLTAGTLTTINGGLIDLQSGLVQIIDGGASADQFTNSIDSSADFALDSGGALILYDNGVLSVPNGFNFSINGGQLTAGSISGNYTFNSGQLTLTDSTQTITIDSSDGNFPTAAYPDSSGLNIDQTNITEVSIAGNFIVGDVGTGTVNVNNIEYNYDNNGNLVQTGGLTTGAAIVGNQSGANGTVNVDSGFWITNGEADIAAQPGSTGSVEVSNGEWTVYGDINVGGSDANGAGGTATLTLNPGGTINNLFQGGNYNTMRLWPGGTVNLNGGAINIGYLEGDGGTFNFNSGTLNIQQGDLDVGASSSIFNSLVLPSGSNLSVGGNLNVDTNTLIVNGGSLAANTLSTSNGGAIDFQGGFTYILSGGASSDEFINSTDSSANFALDNGSLILYNNGVMTIPDGQTLSINEGGYLYAGSISDPGGGFQFNGGELVLTDPSVPVTIDSGGLLKSYYSADGSVVFVDQYRPLLSIAGPLTVGDTGTGTLNIYNSNFYFDSNNNFIQTAGMISGPTIIGNQSGSTGSVYLGDSDLNLPGLWVVNGELDLGAQDGATGNLYITQGDLTTYGDIDVGGTDANGPGGAGTLDVYGASTINANFQGPNSNTMRVFPGGVVNLAGGSISIGYLENDGGAFNYYYGNLNIQQGGLDIGGPNDLISGNVELTDISSLTVNQNTNIDTSTLQVYGGSFSTGSLSFSNGGLIDFTSGTVLVDFGGFDLGNFINSADPSDGFNLDYGQTMYANYNGVITVDPGQTFAINGGTLIAGSVSAALGSFQFNSGSLSINGNGVTTIIDKTDGNITSSDFADHSGLTISPFSSMSVGNITIGDVSTGTLNIDSTTSNSFAFGEGLTSGGAVVGNQSGSIGTVHVGNALTSTPGGWLVIGDLDIAANAGSTGTVIVDDGELTVDANINVGGSGGGPGGTGVLTVNANGTNNAYNTGNNNTLTLYPHGTVNLDGGQIFTGYLSNQGGTLNFNSGLLDIIYDNLDIGAAGDLFGANYNLSTGEDLVVGGNVNINTSAVQVAGGTLNANTLSFSSGGTINFTKGTVIVQNGGVDTSNFTNTTDPTANFAVDSLQVLQVLNDGVVAIPSGKSVHLTGTMEAGSISEPGGGFQFDGGYLILDDPTFGVTVDSGGSLASNTLPLGSSLTLGNLAGGPQGLSVAGQLIVGNSGQGTLDNFGAGFNFNGTPYAGLTSGYTIIGDQTGSNGSVQVGNASTQFTATWNVNGDVDLGEVNGATGTLIVDNGTVNINGDLDAGGNRNVAGGTGTITVNTGGAIYATGDLNLYSKGVFNLDGGSFTTDNLLYQGSHAFNFNSGTLTITGNLHIGAPTDVFFPNLLLAAGDTLIAQQDTTVDTHSLQVHGGTLTTDTIDFAGGGTLDFTAGSVTIQNGGIAVSSMTNSNDSSVYFSLDAGQTLTIENDGNLDARGKPFELNGGTLSTGGVLVPKSANYKNFEFNGGSLFLTNPTETVPIDSLAGVGAGDTPLGVLNMNGTRQLLSIADNLLVGNTATGTLTIAGTSSPSVQVAGPTSIASAAGSTGLITVGNNSTINQSGVLTTSSLTVGDSGTGSLVVQNGGTVVVQEQLTVANEPGSSGSVQVEGGALDVGYGLVINSAGSVTLNGLGAQLTAASITVNPGATFTFTEGALDLTASGLTIGSGGLLGSNVTLNANQSLTLADDAAINTGSTLTLAGGSLTTSSVDVSSGASLLVQTGATLNAPVADGGTVTFNHSDFLPYNDAISGGGSLTQTGSGTLVLTNANTYTGGTTISGGALQLGDGGASGSVSGNILDNAQLIIDRSDPNLAIGNNVSGTGGVTLIGTGTIAFAGSNTYAGGTTITSGKLIAGGAELPSVGTITDNSALLINANTTIGGLAGSGNATVGANSVQPVTLVLASPNNSGSKNGSADSIGSLTVTTGSTLDIKNNTLTIDYGSGADPAATIRSELISGFNANGAKWTGTGIISSLAAANPSHFAVGYADGGNATDRINAKVTAGEVVIKYTVAGDANLSGSVDLSDLVIIASDFGKSGADWAEGDLNYDGNVDLSDLVIVASNFGASLSSVSGSDFSGSFAAEWQLALAEVHGSDVQLPEPCGLAALAAAGMLLRRRRR